MKHLITITLVSFVTINAYSQTDATADDVEKSLSALVSYNFLGGNNSSISNLTPEVFYGWNKKLPIKKSEKASFQLKVGPYVSSQISVKDSSAYLPALMMQGNGGILLNTYLVFGGKSKFIISPLCFGLKFLSGFTDTTKTLIQHNLRFAAGYQYDDVVALTAQYTIGWHGLTSQAEENYKEVFETTGLMPAKYLNITLQTKISSQKDAPENAWYLFATWRSFLNNKDYNNLPNQKILSLGVRKSLDFTAGTPAK